MFTENYFVHRPNQDRDEKLLREAEQYRLLCQLQQPSASAWRPVLFHAGKLFIGLGQWLQRYQTVSPATQASPSYR